MVARTRPAGRVSDLFATNAPAKRRFEFISDADKTDAFRGWLKDQVKAKILIIPEGGNPADAWMAPYVRSAYKQGLVRAFTDSRKYADEKLDFYEGTRAEFLRSTFDAPETTRKLEGIYTRSFESLKNITDTMSNRMGRVFANEVARGSGARETAAELRKTVGGLGRARAATLARTELGHAHAEGQLDGFDELGIEELDLMAEWLTAGDDRVCPQCQARAGKVYTIAEARGLIPFHPNCRCAWRPTTKKNKWVRAAEKAAARGIGIEAALKEVEAENAL